MKEIIDYLNSSPLVDNVEVVEEPDKIKGEVKVLKIYTSVIQDCTVVGFNENKRNELENFVGKIVEPILTKYCDRIDYVRVE